MKDSVPGMKYSRPTPKAMAAKIHRVSRRSRKENLREMCSDIMVSHL